MERFPNEPTDAAPCNSSASATPASDFETRIEDDGVVIVKFLKRNATSVVIPAQIDGQPVVAIAAEAFERCFSLTSVEFPNGLQTIGEGAFEFCYSLTKFIVSSANEHFRAVDDVLFTADGKTLVAYPAGNKRTEYVVPNGVETIGPRAFNGCQSLTSVALPDGLQILGAKAFDGCRSLTKFIVSSANEHFRAVDGVLFTADGKTLVAYLVGNKRTEYVVPDGVKTIGAYAFYGCASLTSVALPDGLTTIGEGAFACRSSLTSVEIPNSVKEIGENAFLWCKSLRSVEIPNSVEKIGKRAFHWCESLRSVEIPNSVKEIGGGAFFGCESLTSVEIPNSVKEIGEYTFFGCAADLTLYGAAGSVAEEYAAENNLRFEAR